MKHLPISLIYLSMLICTSLVHPMLGDRQEITQEIENRIIKGLKGDDLISPYKPSWKNYLIQSLTLSNWLDTTSNRSLLTQLAKKNYGDLIDRILDYDQSLTEHKEFSTAFLEAIAQENLNLVKIFATKTHDINAPIHIHQKSITSYDPLRTPDGTRLLAKSMEKIDVHDTPLDVAAKGFTLAGHKIKPSTSVTKLLLLHNANPNYSSEEGTCLLKLAESNNPSEIKQKIARLLIIGGVNPHRKRFYGKHEDVQAIACGLNDKNLFDCIRDTSNSCVRLLNTTMYSKDINFARLPNPYTKISLRHIRDIRGESLLYRALATNNNKVATKLLYLWPELLTQPNFAGHTILDTLPVQSMMCLLGINHEQQ